MTPLENWTLYCWAAFWLVWMIAWAYKKPTKWSQSTESRLNYTIFYWASFVLLLGSFGQWPILSVLLTKVIPQPLGVVWLGFFLTLAGLFFAIWARFSLGKNWSASMDLKEDHELVMRGAYRIVRHPIYSALLLMFFGTVLVNGTIAGIIGFVLMIYANLIRIRSEEALMTEQFGEQYAAYSKRVKRLVPFVF